MAQGSAGPIERKVWDAGAAGTPLGLLAWALVTFIPSWRQAVPDQLETLIPLAAGLGSALYAAYRAPHTHRPDLSADVTAALMSMLEEGQRARHATEETP